MTNQTVLSPKPLKIFFHAVDGIGHLNACIGMAQSLAQRGHQIYFLLNDAFAGQFDKFGFDEILLRTTKKENPTETSDKTPANPVKAMAEELLRSGFLGPKSPLEKMRDDLAQKENQFMDQIYATSVEFNPQIEEAIEKERPDVFILDCFLVPPAAQKAPLPWINLYSGNPMSMYRSEQLPPEGVGFPTSSDPATWVEYKQLAQQYIETKWAHYQDDLDNEFHYKPPVPITDKSNFIIVSPYLNIYGFPRELDYDDIVPRPDNLIGVDAFCRVVPELFELPSELDVKPGEKLIYVSLGSMGSIDVDLMKRLLSVLAKTPYKYIVSKGQRADEYDLPTNCWGEAYLSQTKILPLVDLVITHGGNNTITEAFSFGKPMIVMPLFADQFENAQRVLEKGFGVRLEPYTFADVELVSAIDKLLNDNELYQRLNIAAKRMKQSNSKQVVCERIEQVVAKYREDHNL